MFGHLPELIIILVIGLIVFGPEKLPEAAANAGKMVREMREVMDSALHPEDTELSEDFSTYYYESLERSGEDVPEFDDDEGSFDEGESQEFGDREDEQDAAPHKDSPDTGARPVARTSESHEAGGNA